MWQIRLLQHFLSTVLGTMGEQKVKKVKFMYSGQVGVDRYIRDCHKTECQEHVMKHVVYRRKGAIYFDRDRRSEAQRNFLLQA